MSRLPPRVAQVMMRARRGAQAMPIAAFCLVVLILMWAVGAITARDWMAQMRLRTAQLRRDEEVSPPDAPPPGRRLNVLQQLWA